MLVRKHISCSQVHRWLNSTIKSVFVKYFQLLALNLCFSPTTFHHNNLIICLVIWFNQYLLNTYWILGLLTENLFLRPKFAFIFLKIVIIYNCLMETFYENLLLFLLFFDFYVFSLSGSVKCINIISKSIKKLV